jgi:hypothetical protein
MRSPSLPDVAAPARRPWWTTALAATGAIALAAPLSACSPTYDWREMRPDGSGAVVSFPCRPSSHARKVRLAGGDVELTLYACTAGDVTFALAWADVADPARVARAVDELRLSAAANIGAVSVQDLPLAVPGATPNAGAGRWAMSGQRSDGQVVLEQMAVVVKGTRVLQATALGTKLPDEAAETFFGGLRLP